MRCTGANVVLWNTVDIFDAKSGLWSTAALSVARGYAAATSLPHQGLVIIAGGGGLFLVGISSGFGFEIALVCLSVLGCVAVLTCCFDGRAFAELLPVAHALGRH